jgi:aspartokinase
MVTISHLVSKIVSSRPILHDAIEEGIISFGNLAEKLTQEIEEELGKKIKHSAVVMALRRYSEETKATALKPKFDYNSEIIMKTNLFDLSVRKSPSLFAKLKKIYSVVNYEKGDVLNIIHGNYEVSIVSNMRYLERIKKELKGEKILNTEEDLVSLSLNFQGDFMHTPGIISTATRKLNWENVNIYELISTLTELTFIVNKKDSTKGYSALQRLVNPDV